MVSDAQKLAAKQELLRMILNCLPSIRNLLTEWDGKKVRLSTDGWTKKFDPARKSLIDEIKNEDPSMRALLKSSHGTFSLSVDIYRPDGGEGGSVFYTSEVLYLANVEHDGTLNPSAYKHLVDDLEASYAPVLALTPEYVAETKERIEYLQSEIKDLENAISF